MYVEIRVDFNLYTIPGTIVPNMVSGKGITTAGVNLKRISIPDLDDKTDVPCMIEFIEYAINEGGVDKEIRSLEPLDSDESFEPPVVFSWRLMATPKEREKLALVEHTLIYKYI